MGIVLVKEIDDLVKINQVFATATDKAGLVSNIREDKSVIGGLPENGLLGILFSVNPNAVVISTGGTAGIIEKAGYKVVEVSDYTGWPEMVTGLVKSMDPKLYVGMLAHPYTKSDAEFMATQKIKPIDMVLANFYPFEDAVRNNPMDVNPEAFEIIRQNMDVGGPTAVHTSRKGFLTTAVATRPADYVRFAQDLSLYKGSISLESRTEGMKHATEDLYLYYKAIHEFMKDITVENVKAAYPIIHNPAR